MGKYYGRDGISQLLTYLKNEITSKLSTKANTADLGTAAYKNSTNNVVSGSTALVESGAVKNAIDNVVSSAYHHAGTKTVEQLVSSLLIAANEGNVYNITNSGTTTADFIEGAGKPINEGSNVGIANVGNNTYKFDLLSGMIDDSNLAHISYDETITGYWTFPNLIIDDGYLFFGGSQSSYYIDDSGNANLYTINATTITLEDINGSLDMNGNDIIGLRSISGDSGNSITIGSVYIDGQDVSNIDNLYVENMYSNYSTITFNNEIDMDNNDIRGVHYIYPANDSIIFNSDETYMDELYVNSIRNSTNNSPVLFGSKIDMNDEYIENVNTLKVKYIWNDSGFNDPVQFSSDINMDYTNDILNAKDIYAQHFYTSGSDYAEKFEELESCPKYRFVTLKGNKIKLAQSPDDYILGITSNNPSFIGDKDNKGIPVGLLGKLWVEQDGTAEVDKYVTVKENGIATKSDTGYRVMEIDGDKVRIIFK